MRGEHARLGVETTTRSDHIARSATKPRSSSSTDQRHSARPDRSWLEKAQHSGPRIGSSSMPVEPWLNRAPDLGVRSSNLFGRAREIKSLLVSDLPRKSFWVGQGSVFRAKSDLKSDDSKRTFAGELRVNA